MFNFLSPNRHFKMNICSVAIDRASSPLLGPLQSSQKKKNCKFKSNRPFWPIVCTSRHASNIISVHYNQIANSVSSSIEGNCRPIEENCSNSPLHRRNWRNTTMHWFKQNQTGWGSREEEGRFLDREWAQVGWYPIFHIFLA